MEEALVQETTEAVEVVQEIVQTIDTTALEELLVVNNELLASIYSCQLFAIGTIAAVGVLFLLYKFIKSFY